MATIYTHAVVGLALGRLGTRRPMPWSYWGLAALLPILPDLDVFSFAPYGAALGHRGITHSLALALAVSVLAAGASFRYFRANPWPLAGMLLAILASHGLLDCFTRGGGNVPLFWPLDAWYGNWGPIPVSDIGFGLPDPQTSRAVRAELLWVWLPLEATVGVVALLRGGRRRPHEQTR